MSLEQRVETFPQRKTKRPYLVRRWKFLIGGLIILIALGHLMFSGLKDWGIYYLTVSEFRAKEQEMLGERVRVNGEVVPDSVVWDAESSTARFTLADGEASLPVVYKGIVPDLLFLPGASAVVEGEYNSQGFFEASTLLTKCPSRYVPQEGEATD